MRILSVHIDGFGKLVNRDIEFGRAANVIRGQNEAGKSTLHAFIEAMLLGPNKKPRGFSKSLYEAMEPWNEDVPYQGRMRIEFEGTEYLIERTFTRGQEKLSVVNEATGEPVEDPEAFLKTVMEDLSSEACRTTISIGQLSAKTGAALQRELTSYIGNMGSTANPELNARRAVEYLEKKKAQLRARIREDAAREYAASLSRIKKIESDLDQPAYENRIRYYEDTRDAVTAEIDNIKQELKETGERIEKASGILAENHIRIREDVKKLEDRAEGLFEQYRKTLEKKRNGLRIAGIIICALLLVLAAAGIFYAGTYPGGRQYCMLGALLTGILLVILIIVQIRANRNFRKAERELQDFMEQRIKTREISKENKTALIRDIHAWDGLLDSRESDVRRKGSLVEKLGELENQEIRTEQSLKEQNAVRIQVEEKLQEENSLRDEAARLRLQIAENNRLKEQIDAIDIAIDTIGDLSDTIGSRLGTYLNNEASRALKDLTAGHYRSMDIGSGNDMSLNSKDGMISVNDVSAGTMDQIYLAVRLAAARFMMKQKDSLPLIFDDSFALYDDDRLRSAVQFVTKDYDGQIFIFTCHHREENALEERADCRMVEL